MNSRSFGPEQSLEIALHDSISNELARAAVYAAESSANEAQLRHELENALKLACQRRGISWTPFQLERPLKSAGRPTKFVDVAHGAVVIEYEYPKSFSGRMNGRASHAREQAQEYSGLLSFEEGRDLREYSLVVWDGSHISFGHYAEGHFKWRDVVAFDAGTANQLLELLRSDGRPLVHPALLQAIVGPDSVHGSALIPAMYHAICAADTADVTSKTKILFSEWKRLFHQVVGFQPANMKSLLARQEISHNEPYADYPAAYLFALNTYIAIVAKVVAACALPNPSQDVLEAGVSVADRLRAVETGEVFENSGILNMISGDFFAWYLDNPSWGRFKPQLEAMLATLVGVDFEIAKKHPSATRDLFKGMYERFIPREVRHQLGEFYTPDWLAEHALDAVGWEVDQPLTDPTCGSGTFLLEALRRRRLTSQDRLSAKALLEGLSGIDLNPLAVLASKASLAVFLSPFLDSANPVRLPIYLADAVNPAMADSTSCSMYRYTMSTEVGSRDFVAPRSLIDDESFFRIFSKIRWMVDSDISAAAIASAIDDDLMGAGVTHADALLFQETLGNLVSLHNLGWNGIWCAILADRFAAGAIAPSTYVCGNPPWIKWSNLPEDYTKTIQDRCKRLGVFSGDKWVGGIEADISTVITFQSIEHYLAPGGLLGFFLPGSVFTTPSSAGFRKFTVGVSRIRCEVVLVEDFDAIAPFDGVTNLPRLVVLKRDSLPNFPVPYRIWTAGEVPVAKLRRSSRAAEFRELATSSDVFAVPVPGGDGDRPWLIGSANDQKVFETLFRPGERVYAARKGVTADRNGIYWVQEKRLVGAGLVEIVNAAAVGRTKGIPTTTGTVECEHIFPLLRGQGVSAFRASPDATHRILVPQRGMHGDPELHISHPLTYNFLRKFKTHLESRSSLRRFQKGKPYYSLWSTGSYTFSPFKVLWREIGKTFAAAYIGSASTTHCGEKPVIPDHKLYFIPVETEAEAAYLTGFLNSNVISRAISAYASQLSLGVSVAEYLHIPEFDPSNEAIVAIASLSAEVSVRSDGITAGEAAQLDQMVRALLRLA